jgi:hypothetical protein
MRLEAMEPCFDITVLVSSNELRPSKRFAKLARKAHLALAFPSHHLANACSKSAAIWLLALSNMPRPPERHHIPWLNHNGRRSNDNRIFSVFLLRVWRSPVVYVRWAQAHAQI